MVGEGIMNLEELQVYQLSMDLGERVWEIVIEWDYFAKDTIGKQFVKAVDSVAANLSEGFGRYYYKENKQFCCYSRGSLHETLTWLTKAKNRGLINVEDFHSIRNDIDTLGLKLNNNYIGSIGKRGTTSDRMTNNDSEAL
jgi:four helix bundle protein